MSDKPTLLCVDDEPFIQAMFADALSDEFQVQLAIDAEQALHILHTVQPELIIMDVGMPGMDGYECCRRIKQRPGFEDVPLLFLSGREAIEDRLRGFEAGGDDYVVKPFNVQLLKLRLRHLLNLARERRELKQTLHFASNTAMTAMVSMSELGPVLQAMKDFNASNDLQAVAEATLTCLASFELEGAVQVRWPDNSVTLTSRGPASPLDESVISHMATMHRIERFSDRLSVNYPNVTLLVHNMPVDEERSGRIRDHLAMLAEAADVRTRALQSGRQADERGVLIHSMITEITEALAHIDATQRATRGQVTLVMHDVRAAVERALLGVALSEEQEGFLASVVQDGLDQIARVYNSDLLVQNRLSQLVNRLKQAMANG